MRLPMRSGLRPSSRGHCRRRVCVVNLFDRGDDCCRPAAKVSVACADRQSLGTAHLLSARGGWGVEIDWEGLGGFFEFMFAHRDEKQRRLLAGRGRSFDRPGRSDGGG